MLYKNNISDIKSSTTRSLLRGLLDKTLDRKKGIKILNPLIKSITLEDAHTVEALLYRSPLYAHLQLSDEFSGNNPFADTNIEIARPQDAVSLTLLSLRSAYNEKVIVNFFNLLANLNNYICELDEDNIKNTIDEIISTCGLSFILLRKIASAKALFSLSGKESDFLLPYLNKFGLSKRGIPAVLTVDTIGIEYDYIALRKAVAPSVKRQNINQPLWQQVGDWILNPICTSNKEFFSTLNTNNQISLVDSIYYYLCYKDNISKIISTTPPDVPLTDNIIESWKELKESSKKFTSLSYTDDHHYDFVIYRGATAWLENDTACSIRALGDNYYQRLDNDRVPAPNLSSYVSSQFSLLDNFNQLLLPVNLWIKSDKLHLNSTSFLRSLAFFYLVDQGVDLHDMSSKEFISLMASTRDLARLVNSDLLRDLVSVENKKFVNLIIYSLLVTESKRTHDQYFFKDTLQEIIVSEFEGDILLFFNFLYANAKEIVNYYASILDEHMLSQLPELIESGDSVYETRANILDWYADAFDDINSKERAKQLRLDRKIQKARGKIHDARLNVDSQRFIDWVSDNALQRIISSIRDGELAYKTYSDYISLSSSRSGMAIAHRDPLYSGITTLNEILLEFCTNNSFGVASYLGRRIRHGTMKGTLISGLKDLRADKTYENLFKVNGCSDDFARWYDTYCKNVDSLVKKMYFYEKNNTNAILSATINSKFKYDIAVNCLKALEKQYKIDGHFSSLPKLLESYCWLLLGPELEKINLNAPKWRMDWGVIDAAKTFSYRSSNTNKFCTALNNITDDNFKIFAGWFKTPSSLHPEAELSEIISVVMLEATDEYSDFKPQIERTGETDLKLIGAVYYYVYDGIAIAIKNVAQHGNNTGVLKIHTSNCIVQGVEVLNIDITSDLKEIETEEKIKKSIEDKISLDVDNADVIEGGSGLRKLCKMKTNAKLLTWSYDIVGNKFTIKMSYILSGVLIK